MMHEIKSVLKSKVLKFRGRWIVEYRNLYEPKIWLEKKFKSQEEAWKFIYQLQADSKCVEVYEPSYRR